MIDIQNDFVTGVLGTKEAQQMLPRLMEKAGSFQGEILMTQDMGLLTMKGKDLHVSRLTLEKGEVDIDGSVDSLAYSSNEAYRKSGESLFSRLFR